MHPKINTVSISNFLITLKIIYIKFGYNNLYNILALICQGSFKMADKNSESNGSFLKFCFRKTDEKIERYNSCLLQLEC